MKTTKQIGDAGEELAAKELKKAGYNIIGSNFRTRFGEIDIIAKDSNVLVFIEVKAKNSDYFGTAAEMITTKKLEKVSRMAQWYIQENEYFGEWRIDAVVIDGAKTQILKNITQY